MRIPNKIKIGGIWYDVKFTKDMDCCGRINRNKCLIEIADEMIKSVQEYTFLHEIIHAINTEINEVTIDFIAHTLHQVITDNNLLERRTKCSKR